MHTQRIVPENPDEAWHEWFCDYCGLEESGWGVGVAAHWFEVTTDVKEVPILQVCSVRCFLDFTKATQNNKNVETLLVSRLKRNNPDKTSNPPKEKTT